MRLKFVVPLRHYSSSGPNLLKKGDVLTQTRRFSDSDINVYSKLTHDCNPLHSDAECAKRSGFGGVLVPGMLVASLFPSIIASHFPGAVYAKQTLDFRSPVFIGDEIVGEVQAINIRQVNERFMAKFVTRCFRSAGGVVIVGEATTILPTLAMEKP